jgi:hypothetical protein
MTIAEKKKKTGAVVSKRRQEARKQAKKTEQRVEEKKVASVPWTEDEDHRIYNYGHAGRSFVDLAESMGTTVGACRARYGVLKSTFTKFKKTPPVKKDAPAEAFVLPPPAIASESDEKEDEPSPPQSPVESAVAEPTEQQA